MTSFDVLKQLEQFVVVPEGAQDGDEATDVLGVPPTGVMPHAIRVRDECCAMHCLNQAAGPTPAPAIRADPETIGPDAVSDARSEVSSHR